jgi:hypothetical protein
MNETASLWVKFPTRRRFFMVKGISRQVIVVQSPEPKIFEQAIFILKEDAVGKEGVTDEILLKEARRLIQSPENRKLPLYCYGPAWACMGSAVTALVWLFTAML